jgi:BirA family biotin operon repressor/biotin-[acetyl-CoA-carboxylase] ligase
MSGVANGGPAPVPDRVERGPLGTRFSEVRRFAEIDSTNRYLLDVARHGGVADVVAVADHQSAGRGRLGRRWEAPAGANLLLSVLLDPRLEVGQLHLCSAAMSLAAADACRLTTGVEPSIKWPNDLLAGERKLAGVLAESTPPPSGDGTRLVVVGIGINVRWPPPDDVGAPEPVPDDLRGSATSLWREAGSEPDPVSLLEPLLRGLDERVTDLDDAASRARLASEYRSRCATVGQPVRVVLSGTEVLGEAVDITLEGQLVVDVGACFTTVSAGDVVHLHRGE